MPVCGHSKEINTALKYSSHTKTNSVRIVAVASDKKNDTQHCAHTQKQHLSSSPSSISCIHKLMQARRQGGFEGVHSNLPFDFQKMHLLTVCFKRFSISLAANENHRCPNKSGNLFNVYAAAMKGCV